MRIRRLLSPARLANGFVVLVALAIVAELVRRSPTAREVVWTGVTNLFGFFTTPFVLEASLAVFGLLAVVTWNEWRRQQDGDEWVYLPADPPSSGTPNASSSSDTPSTPP
jgi:hypothetical protein